MGKLYGKPLIEMSREERVEWIREKNEQKRAEQRDCAVALVGMLKGVAMLQREQRAAEMRRDVEAEWAGRD